MIWSPIWIPWLQHSYYRVTASKSRRIMSAFRHDTPAKPRVQWGQSPKWNPGYTRTKSNIELRRSGTITRAFVLRLRSTAPLGLNKYIPIINPGLAPWAMLGYRPYRASLRLPYHFIILMWLYHSYWGLVLVSYLVFQGLNNLNTKIF